MKCIQIVLVVLSVTMVTVVFARTRDEQYHCCNKGLPKLDAEQSDYEEKDTLDDKVIQVAKLAAKKLMDEDNKFKYLIAVTAARYMAADKKYTLTLLGRAKRPIKNPDHKRVCTVEVKENGEFVLPVECSTCYQ